MNNKSTFFKKLKTWWKHLHHRWFLVFQICTSFLLYELIKWTIEYDPLYLLLVSWILTLVIFIVQFGIIVYYYGWRICCKCIVAIPLAVLLSILTMLFLVSLFNILSVILSDDLVCVFNVLDNYVTYFVLYLPFFAPIIPQYWRLDTHGRK